MRSIRRELLESGGSAAAFPQPSAPQNHPAVALPPPSRGSPRHPNDPLLLALPHYRPTAVGRHPEERSDEGSPSCPDHRAQPHSPKWPRNSKLDEILRCAHNDGGDEEKKRGYRLNVGKCTISVGGTGSVGFPAFRQAANPPAITNALNPCTRSKCATLALVTSFRQVQYK
jgi:hypothetical protein